MKQLPLRSPFVSLKRRFSARWLWLVVALLPVLTIVAAYQVPYLYTFPMDSCKDSSWLSGFEEGGVTGDIDFCWSTTDSTISFPTIAQNQPYRLVLRLASAQPQDKPPPELTLIANGVPVETTQVATDWHTYQVSLEPARVPDAPDLKIELKAPTFVPSESNAASQDTRELGLGVDWVRLRPQGPANGLFVLPPFLYGLVWSLAAWFGLAILLRTPFARHPIRLGLAILGEQGLLAYALIFQRMSAVSFLPEVFIVLGALWFLVNEIPIWHSRGPRSTLEFFHTLGIANPRWRRVLEIGVIAVLAADLIVNDIWPLRTHSLFDFVAYYAGASVWMHQGDYYNPQVLQQYITSHKLLQGNVPFVYPPVAILFFAPLAQLSLADAKVIWLLVDYACLIGAGVFLMAALRRSFRAPASPLWFALLAISRPTGVTIGSGQIGVLLLFLFALGFWAWTSRHSELAGAVIAVATGLKLFPGLLLVYFLYRRNWRAVVGSIGTGLALFIASLGAGGIEAWQRFVTQGLQSIPVDFNDPYEQSVNGFLQRFTNSVGAQLGWNGAEDISSTLRFFAILVGVTFILLTLWRLSRQHPADVTQAEVEYGAVIALMLLVLPVVWEHYLIWLILPMFILINTLAQYPFSRRAHVALVLALALAWFCIHYGPRLYSLPGFPGALTSLGLVAALCVYFCLLFVLAQISKPARLQEPKLRRVPNPVVG